MNRILILFINKIYLRDLEAQTNFIPNKMSMKIKYTKKIKSQNNNYQMKLTLVLPMRMTPI